MYTFESCMAVELLNILLKLVSIMRSKILSEKSMNQSYLEILVGRLRVPFWTFIASICWRNL